MSVTIIVNNRQWVANDFYLLKPIGAWHCFISTLKYGYIFVNVENRLTSRTCHVIQLALWREKLENQKQIKLSTECTCGPPGDWWFLTSLNCVTEKEIPKRKLNYTQTLCRGKWTKRWPWNMLNLRQAKSVTGTFDISVDWSLTQNWPTVTHASLGEMFGHSFVWNYSW